MENDEYAEMMKDYSFDDLNKLNQRAENILIEQLANSNPLKSIPR